VTGLISVDEALAFLLEHRPEMPVEIVPLDAALGRTLAAPLHAKLTQPPAALSAMDGYAVRLADVAAPGARLTIVGEAPAGSPFAGPVAAGEAVRIFTGGYVPDGADHIVIQETVERDGDTIICRDAYAEPRHIRAAGRDFAEGDVLVPMNARIGPPELAIAAAANHSELMVRKRPKVAIITNGNELKPPGTDLLPGEIVSSNPYSIGALAKKWGGDVLQTGHSADSVASILDTLSPLEDGDIFVPIGGASVGDHDHMRTAFREFGFQPIFEKIAVRPGKPTWFSKKDDQLALGLPGNPASAYVCAQLFLRVLLADAGSLETRIGRLAAPVPENGPRETFMRGVATIDPSGAISVEPAPDQDSSLLTPFLSANALIRRLPHAPAANDAEIIEFVPIGSF